MHPKIEEEYSRYIVLSELTARARDRAISDKTDKYASEIGIALGKTGHREETLNLYFDELSKSLEKSSWMRMVATFESEFFIHLPTAISTSESIIRSHYPSGQKFAKISLGLVKSYDDIRDLSGILSVVESQVSQADLDKLREIVRYRNRLAHGERFGEATQMTLGDAAGTLSDILTQL